MKTFVVGFLDFFDNDLQLNKVQAENPIDAIKTSGFVEGYDFPVNATMDEIEDIMLDCDSVISVIEV